MKKILIAGLMICASVASVTASAETSLAGVYGGVDMVANRYNLDFGSGVSTSNSGGTNIGAKFVLGYNLNSNWALEGGYANFGSQSANYSVSGSNVTVKSSANTWYGAVKGTMPINEQFSVYGKLGAARNHTEASTLGVTAKENKTDLYSAIGGQYNLTKNVSLNLEVERFGKNPDLGMKSTAISTGVRYSF